MIRITFCFFIYFMFSQPQSQLRLSDISQWYFMNYSVTEVLMKEVGIPILES